MDGVCKCSAEPTSRSDSGRRRVLRFAFWIEKKSGRIEGAGCEMEIRAVKDTWL